jgi:hypothetical protein
MLEITIQRRVGGGWPVVAERHRFGTVLSLRSEGRLELDEPSNSSPRVYGTRLGQALLRDAIRDSFVQARSEQPDGVRVLLFIEADDLKSWRWEWLCAPVDSTWDFVSQDQRVLYSLYLPSLTDRAYPPIGRNDLRALVVVANPADPDRRYGLEPFDLGENVTRVQSMFDEPVRATILARVAGAVGAPTLVAIETHLTEGTSDGPYTILHLICHGRVSPQGGGETILYLERSSPDPASGQVLAQPVQGSELIERLRRIGRLPYLIFLSICESAAPEAEQRLGGLAQRLVRELGIPAVIGMTERVTIATAHALAEQFYSRLFAQTNSGEVDRALVQAYAGLAGRPDVNIPVLYSRLGAQPLFSKALDRPLTDGEIRTGLQKLDDLLAARAPVLRPRLAENARQLQSRLGTSPEALCGTARQERDHALTRVNELCSEAVEISFHALAQGEQPPTYDARQPFRGLSPFRSEDREFFFGRDSMVEKLQRKLAVDNFLAVLGPSGCGKSSLVLAGLAPKLKAQISDLQVIDDLTPGSAPLEQLKTRQSKVGPGPVLYIVDQFEELFTLCKDEGQRSAFADELLTLAESNRVVLTMRADFWGECARYSALKELMLARQELVAPMTAAELRGAIEQQAAKVGLRFEADLSNRMLDEVAGEPGAMPLLQHALLELWKRRHGKWLRAEEYRAVGGVKQAIAETADRLYDEASPSEQRRMQDIFLRLTQVENVESGEGRRDTRRRISLSEVLPAGGNPEETKTLLKRLADNVLVVTSRNELTGDEELEVSHEALIRYWPKLVGWINADRSFQAWLRQLKPRVDEWQKHPEDDGTLLRGGPLSVAEDWLGRRRGELSAQEQAYVDTSIAEQQAALRRQELLRQGELERQKQLTEVQTLRAEEEGKVANAQRQIATRTRIGFVVALVLAVAAGAGMIIALVAENRATVNARRALAALAQNALGESPANDAVKLALAAWPRSTHNSEIYLQSVPPTISKALSEARIFPDPFSPDAFDFISQFQISDDGARVLYQSDYFVYVWDVLSRRNIGRPIRIDAIANTGLSLDRRGAKIATWSKDFVYSDNIITISDAASGTQISKLIPSKLIPKPTSELQTHTVISGASFSSDGTRLLTWSEDGTVRVWDTETGTQIGKELSHAARVDGAVLSKDERRILSWSDDAVRLWDSDGRSNRRAYAERWPSGWSGI